MTAPPDMTSPLARTWTGKLLRLRVALGRMLAFQTLLRPEHVRYLGRASVFVIADEKRGSYLRRSWGVTQPNVAAAWLAAMTAMRPDVAVDVGANYGEIALLGRYGAGRRCLVIEPHPHLAPVLERSVDSHRSASNIRVAQCAVAAAGAARVALYTDPSWSGTSSLTPTEHAVAHDVEARTLDELVLSNEDTVRHLLLKIDVEGSELDVLRGGAGVLDGAEAVCVIIECNAPLLERAGSSSRELIEQLERIGVVYELTSNGRLRSLQDAPEVKGDLLVYRGPRHVFFLLRLLTFLRAFVGG